MRVRNLDRLASRGHVILFYGLILALLCVPQSNQHSKKDLQRTLDLINAKPLVYPRLVDQMKTLRPYIPENNAAVTLILDQLHAKDASHAQFHHEVENLLAPLIINENPDEKFALVLTSTPDVAEKRLKETGYHWYMKLTKVSGIAEKDK